MPLLIALATSIGLLAVVATWLVLNQPAGLNLQLWAVFIAWACFYHSGGKTDGLIKTIAGMALGAVLGMLSVMLAGQLGALGGLAVPVAVGIGAAACVLAAYIPFFSTIPATVYGFASIAALILLKGAASPQEALLPIVGSVVIGAVFGWLSESLGGMLTSSSPAAAE